MTSFSLISVTAAIFLCTQLGSSDAGGWGGLPQIKPWAKPPPQLTKVVPVPKEDCKDEPKESSCKEDKCDKEESDDGGMFGMLPKGLPEAPIPKNLPKPPIPTGLPNVPMPKGLPTDMIPGASSLMGGSDDKDCDCECDCDEECEDEESSCDDDKSDDDKPCSGSSCSKQNPQPVVYQQVPNPQYGQQYGQRPQYVQQNRRAPYEPPRQRQQRPLVQSSPQGRNNYDYGYWG